MMMRLRESREKSHFAHNRSVFRPEKRAARQYFAAGPKKVALTLKSSTCFAV